MSFALLPTQATQPNIFAVTMSAALANLHAPPTPKPLLSGYKQNNQREGDLL